MSAAVVDASVIVKWFVSEDFSKQSLQLREDYVDRELRIMVPSVATYEVLNALRYSGGFGTQELLQVSRVLDNYQFVEVPLAGRYSAEALELAMAHGITVYDASYLSIGKLRVLPVYTADENLLKKVSGFDFVHHVREYSSEGQSEPEDNKRSKSRDHPSR